MIRLLFIVVTCLPTLLWSADSPATRPAVTFAMVDVVVDSGDQPLAAWQVELKATSGNVKIVGVEGGEHRDAYRDPPYYDPAALAGGRIILASFTTSDEAPKGRVVVARVHLQVEGEYKLRASVASAADRSGKSVDARASLGPSPSKDKE